MNIHGGERGKWKWKRKVARMRKEVRMEGRDGLLNVRVLLVVSTNRPEPVSLSSFLLFPPRPFIFIVIAFSECETSLPQIRCTREYFV